MIAIIAGTGRLPVHACQSLLEKQKPFFVVVLFPEDNLEQLQAVVGTRATIIAQNVYKVGNILDLLKQQQTTHTLLIGKVDKRNLLQHLKFDWLALKILGSLIGKSDNDIIVFEEDWGCEHDRQEG